MRRLWQVSRLINRVARAFRGSRTLNRFCEKFRREQFKIAENKGRKIPVLLADALSRRSRRDVLDARK